MKAYSLLILFSIFLSIRSQRDRNKNACMLPAGCHTGLLHVSMYFQKSQFFSMSDMKGLICPVRHETFGFKFLEWETEVAETFYEVCYSKIDSLYGVELRFPRSHWITLDARLNLQGIIDFLLLIHRSFVIHVLNVEGFGVDLALRQNVSAVTDSMLRDPNCHVFIFNSRIEFYAENKTRLGQSCENLSHLEHVNSVFQVTPDNRYGSFTLLSCRFRQRLCPLLFANTRISLLRLIGMTITFYKHNVLMFTNDIFQPHILDSDIRSLEIYRAENLVLDSNFLHPSVFYRLEEMLIFGSVESIENSFFARFEHLRNLKLDAYFFRKLINKKGIGWIRAINPSLDVNLNDDLEIRARNRSIFRLDVEFVSDLSVSHVFPDIDFCLYVDFPFRQLVVLTKHERSSVVHVNRYTKPTCLFRWLTQYYLALQRNSEGVFFNNIETKLATESAYPQNCSFDEFVTNCKSQNFAPNKIWDVYEARKAGNYFQVVVIISYHVFSLVGLVTNSILILTISSRKNEDVFREFKQYRYLAALSVYNILILTIQLVSWLSDCKDTYRMFCLPIRRFVPIQFFQIVFKETLVVAFRFMGNFAYIAFAFNRVALIGKDHSNLVKFVSEVGIKTYLFSTGIISMGLSVVKIFKYKVNYDHPELNYPFIIEADLEESRTVSKDIYFVANLVCDLLNYIVFVLVNFIIDVYMLIRLRNTLKQKLQKLDEMNQTKTTSTTTTTTTKLDDIKRSKEFISRLKCNKIHKEQMQEAMMNAFRMVLFSSALNFLFKLPSSIMPLLNVIGTFYYTNKGAFIKGNLAYDGFLNRLVISRFNILIPDFAELLLTILAAGQWLILARFDKNLKLGLDRFLGLDDETKSKQIQTKS